MASEGRESFVEVTRPFPTRFEILGSLTLGFPCFRRYKRGDTATLADILPVLPRALGAGLVRPLSPKPTAWAYCVALKAHRCRGREIEPGEIVTREDYPEPGRMEYAGLIWPLTDPDLNEQRRCATCGRAFLGSAALAAHAKAWGHKMRKRGQT